MKIINKIKILLLIFYFGFIIIPLFSIFSYANINTLNEILFGIKFVKVLSNTIKVALVSTIFVLLLAYFAAFCIERTCIKGKFVFKLIFIISMLIPSISNGIGITILLGNNGIITRIFNVNIGIYGFKGIVIGEILYAFPIAFLMLDDILKYENYALYEETIVLGIDKWNVFKNITLPYLKKPLFSIMFCVFTLIITDYGIPLIVGGKYITLPLLMYQEVVGRLNFANGAVYSIILLIIALLSFVIDIKNRKNNRNLRYRNFVIKKKYNLPSYLYCIIISIIVLLPVVSFVFIINLNELSKIINMDLQRSIYNSIITSLMASIFGTFIAFVTAYITTKKHNLINTIINILTIISLGIPGLVLGLSYVILFKNTLIYGTLIIIIIVNIVHFISSPYLMAYNSLSKININKYYASKILGISEYSYVKSIVVPANFHTIIEMFIFYFVNCMMTISAVSFISNVNTRPVSLLINQFQEQMQMGASAVISIIILIINLLVKIFLEKVNHL